MREKFGFFIIGRIKESEQSRKGAAIHTQEWKSSGFFPTYPKNDQAHQAEELKVPYESGRRGNHQPLVHHDHPHNIPLMACFLPPPADLFHTSIQSPGKPFLHKRETIRYIRKPRWITRSILRRDFLGSGFTSVSVQRWTHQFPWQSISDFLSQSYLTTFFASVTTK